MSEKPNEFMYLLHYRHGGVKQIFRNEKDLREHLDSESQGFLVTKVKVLDTYEAVQKVQLVKTKTKTKKKTKKTKGAENL